MYWTPEDPVEEAGHRSGYHAVDPARPFHDPGEVSQGVKIDQQAGVVAPVQVSPGIPIASGMVSIGGTWFDPSD